MTTSSKTRTTVCLIFISGLTSLYSTATSMAQENKTSSPSLGSLDTWDDGLAEMSYYRAVDTLYGKPRSYTRTIIINRQWMHPQSGVKTDLIASDSVQVFKVNMVEEIPTENYNYRYQTTIFIDRNDLSPFKMVTSSQEWCGTTFKHLRWSNDELTVKNFSYFPSEGDTTSSIKTDAVPYESLLLIARDVASSGQPRTLNVLEPMRSTHRVEPKAISATMTIGAKSQVTTPLGTISGVRIDVQWSGQPTSFVVEAKAPYRLLRYRTGGAKGSLVQIERRAYWDRNWPSSFHKANQAP